MTYEPYKGAVKAKYDILRCWRCVESKIIHRKRDLSAPPGVSKFGGGARDSARSTG
jgi:hypothetical protein